MAAAAAFMLVLMLGMIAVALLYKRFSILGAGLTVLFSLSSLAAIGAGAICMPGHFRFTAAKAVSAILVLSVVANVFLEIRDHKWTVIDASQLEGTLLVIVPVATHARRQKRSRSSPEGVET